MLIVHTSDWHAGRLWKGIDRLDELEAVLTHLGDFIEHERADLLVMTGDVFDTRGPSATAERAVFRFFRRVGRAGTKTVVIAGNHDDPLRLDAWGTLAELVDVTTVSRPRRADQGGVVEHESRSGQRVAAVPFAKPSDLVSAAQMAEGDTEAHQRYAEGMRGMIAHLTTRFRPDAVNLLLAHTHLDAAVLAGSERRVHLGEEWAATAQILPATAHYVGLAISTGRSGSKQHRRRPATPVHRCSSISARSGSRKRLSSSPPSPVDRRRSSILPTRAGNHCTISGERCRSLRCRRNTCARSDGYA